MGFGALSHLPDKYLNQKLLKQIFDRYDIYDNTIYSDAAAVNITTDKIGHALGLSSRGLPPPEFNSKNHSTSSPYNFLPGEHKELELGTSYAIWREFKRPCSTATMVAYWTGETLEKRIKQEKKHDAGLLKRGKMRAEKQRLKKKSTNRVPSLDAESQTDSEPLASSSSDGEGDSESERQQQERRPKKKEDRRDASSSSSGSDETVSEEPQPQQQVRRKKINDRAVVGSNAPVNPTQQSAAVVGLPQSDDDTLADALKNIKKRKKQQVEDMNTKKRTFQGNEGGERIQGAGRSASEAAVGSSDKTRMFDSFETVSLGREDSDIVGSQGPSVMPSQFGKDVSQVGHEVEVQLESEPQPVAEVQLKLMK
ncbi:hypothetical protein PIB30_080294 [Stylosanthes scabra]|uniref:Uncharacterized protein n=1 Tax=Stylosanthes scabra TaxID=79078 RepID=A0ABU6TS03_9FABA|nr:hypothetical protein [Stylosanthes scabra]